MTQDNTGINSLLDLTNKRVIATGAAQGLGFAISRRLSEAGAAVLMVTRRRRASVRFFLATAHTMRKMESEMRAWSNERPGVDAGWRVLFAFQPAWPRATQAER